MHDDRALFSRLSLISLTIQRYIFKVTFLHLSLMLLYCSLKYQPLIPDNVQRLRFKKHFCLVMILKTQEVTLCHILVRTVGEKP